MIYFTHLTSSNNQHKRLHRLLIAKSHLLVENKDAFVNDLKLHIAALNQDYPRCGSLNANVFSSLDGTTRINVGNSKTNLAQFAIYEIKNSSAFAPQRKEAWTCACGHAEPEHYSEWGHITCMECDSELCLCCQNVCPK